MNQQPPYTPQMASVAAAINKPIKIVQCTALFNEELFAEAVILGLYEKVDQIILVEGAVGKRANATEDGHSTDRTVEIIEDIKKNKDTQNKILHVSIKRPWQSLEEQKQTFLDLTSPGDWLLILDADEMYHPEDVDKLRLAADMYPHATEFVPFFKHYYRDWYHIARPGPEWQPTHQRIVKRFAGDRYLSHPVITRGSGECSYFSPWMQHRRYMVNSIFIHHAGYARRGMDEIMAKKQLYYKDELAKHGEAATKFDEKAEAWLYKKERAMDFLRSDGADLPLAWKNLAFVEYHDMYFESLEKDMDFWSDEDLYSRYINGKPVGTVPLCMEFKSNPAMAFFDNRIFI